MTRTSTTLMMIAALLVALPASAQEDRPQSRPTIAVVPFDTTRTGFMPPPGFGETIAELLTDRLMSGNAFRIIDPSLIAAPGDEVGRMPASVLMERAGGAGVRFLVLGTVTRLSMEQHSSTGGGVIPIPIVGGLIRRQKTDSIVGLTIRVIDVRTGEIINTATARGDSSGTTSSGGGVAVVYHLPLVAGKHSSSIGIQDGLLANAVGEAVTAVAEQLIAVAPRLGGPDLRKLRLLYTYMP